MNDRTNPFSPGRGGMHLPGHQHVTSQSPKAGVVTPKMAPISQPKKQPRIPSVYRFQPGSKEVQPKMSNTAQVIRVVAIIRKMAR